MQKKSKSIDRVVMIGGLITAGIMILAGVLLLLSLKYNIIRLN